MFEEVVVVVKGTAHHRPTWVYVLTFLYNTDLVLASMMFIDENSNH